MPSIIEEAQYAVPTFKPLATKPLRSRKMAADAAMGRIAHVRPIIEPISDTSINPQNAIANAEAARLARDKESTLQNMYSGGGSGAVARENGPAKQPTNIGGLPRDELIRRMENAGISMRGSPSARGAVMGMYADSVKAIDAGELQKNQGNIEADQTVYRGNMAANMQQAQGKQAFGNEMGILNRKAGLDAAAAAASADPEMRAAQLRKLTSETDVNEAAALMKKREFEAGITAKEDVGVEKLAADLFANGKGGYPTYEAARVAAAEKQLASGAPVRSNTPLRELDNALLDETLTRIGTNDILDEAMSKSWRASGLGREGLKSNEQYSNDSFEIVPEDSWANSVRTTFGAEPIQTLRVKGKTGYLDPTLRLLPGDEKDAKLIRAYKARQRGQAQQGQ